MQENWEPQGEYEDLLATNLLGEKESGSRVLTSTVSPSPRSETDKRFLIELLLFQNSFS